MELFEQVKEVIVDTLNCTPEEVTPEARACNDHGIDAYLPILQRPCTEREAMELSQASANLEATAAQVFHLITACETWRANS